MNLVRVTNVDVGGIAVRCVYVVRVAVGSITVRRVAMSYVGVSHVDVPSRVSMRGVPVRDIDVIRVTVGLILVGSIAVGDVGVSDICVRHVAVGCIAMRRVLVGGIVVICIGVGYIDMGNVDMGYVKMDAYLVIHLDYRTVIVARLRQQNMLKLDILDTPANPIIRNLIIKLDETYRIELGTHLHNRPSRSGAGNLPKFLYHNVYRRVRPTDCGPPRFCVSCP